MTHKGFMQRHSRIFVARRSCGKLYAETRETSPEMMLT